MYISILYRGMFFETSQQNHFINMFLNVKYRGWNFLDVEIICPPHEFITWYLWFFSLTWYCGGVLIAESIFIILLKLFLFKTFIDEKIVIELWNLYLKTLQFIHCLILLKKFCFYFLHIIVQYGPAHLICDRLFFSCRPVYISTVFFPEKEKLATFKIAPLQENFPQDLLRLKLEIVHTMNFIWVCMIVCSYKDL